MWRWELGEALFLGPPFVNAKGSKAAGCGGGRGRRCGGLKRKKVWKIPAGEWESEWAHDCQERRPTRGQRSHTEARPDGKIVRLPPAVVSRVGASME